MAKAGRAAASSSGATTVGGSATSTTAAAFRCTGSRVGVAMPRRQKLAVGRVKKFRRGPPCGAGGEQVFAVAERLQDARLAEHQ
jgi:hypothetical protein